jgi:hypothetical protein
MNDRQQQLWIGMVEIRPLTGESKILGTALGAFVNVVTWAADVEQFRNNADLVIASLGGLYVSEVIDPEPVEARRARHGNEFEASIQDLIFQAQSNPDAVLYGSFHLFEREDP